jgi:hypothetical protein
MVPVKECKTPTLMGFVDEDSPSVYHTRSPTHPKPRRATDKVLKG